jgi:hypothetical protein
LSWAAATDNVAVSAYRIYRNGLLFNTLTANMLTLTDNTVTPSTSYSYSISAGDLAGNWSPEKAITLTTSAQTMTGSAAFDWLPPTERENGSSLTTAEIAEYELRYRKTTENTYSYVSIDKNAVHTSINNLNGDYVFEIATIDTDGLYSNFVKITPH